MTSQPAGSDPRSPDPHGHAALLLVESLIHGMIAGRLIDVGQAIEIVEAAAEVQADDAGDPNVAPATLDPSLSLLNAIAESLRPDLT